MVDNGKTDRSSGARLLMANQPRAYREVIAEAVRELRPGFEVVTVEPGELDRSVLTLEPDAVICNSASEVVRKKVPVWIELYPDFASSSVVSMEGRLSTLEDIQHSDILSILDRTERLV